MSLGPRTAGLVWWSQQTAAQHKRCTDADHVTAAHRLVRLLKYSSLDVPLALKSCVLQALHHHISSARLHPNPACWLAVTGTAGQHGP